MLGEKYTLDIRPTFIDELDRAVTYIEQNLGNPLLRTNSSMTHTRRLTGRLLTH